MTTSIATTTIQPYLFFGGRCEEALEFYRSALGAEIEMLMRFNESPEPHPPGMVSEDFEKKIMHASFSVQGNRLMASDGCGPEESGFKGFSLAINLPTEADVDRVFAALAEGGKVQMPLGKTFWSARFGMVEDRFGIGWMVGVAE